MTIAMRATTTLSGVGIDFERLGAQLLGQLILPGDPGYEAARRVIYITVDRHPLAIVRAAHAGDVAAGVAFAREHGLTLAVRSGGHGLAGHSVADDALVIDLSGMKRIAIDPAARLTRVEGGATSGDLAGPAGAHGLALSTGDTASVGLGGLTTGGGIGLLVRKHGLAIDSLVAAQVVTADGAIVTASADEHPDLFWAIRGGGGNFGIVTEFVFRLAPVGQILGGLLILPASRAVLRGYLDYVTAAPEELTTIANLMIAPPLPFVPPAAVGQPALAILVCWAGNLADGERALAPLRALAAPVADLVSPMPYPAIYNFTAEQGAPHALAFRSMFADHLSDAALDAMLAALGRATTPLAAIQLRGLGGAMARIGRDATAFAHRDRRYLVALLASWLDASEDATPHEAWIASLWGAIRHEGAGVYVNFLQDEGEARLHDAYPAATHARLAAIKAQYDPENVFRLNQNIRPAGA